MRRNARTEGFGRAFSAAAALRRRAVAAISGATIAAATFLFLLFSFLPSSVVSGRGSGVPGVVALLVLSLFALAAYLGRRIARGLRPERLAAEVDRAAGLGDGDFLGALELQRTGPGTSVALAARHRAQVANALSGVRSSGLFAVSRRRWTHRVRTAWGLALGAALAVTLAGLARPERTATAAVSLAAPWRVAFPDPLSPLEISPGDTSVVRGERLRVAVRAVGRSRVELGWRVEGEPTRRTSLFVSAAGAAIGATDPIEAPIRYWVLDPSGVTSDTFRARPLEPLLVQTLSLRLAFPGYLGRPPETHARPIPPLIVPVGTRLELEGRANHPLAEAELRYRPAEPYRSAGTGEHPAGGTVRLEVDGPGFRGRFVARASGTWLWWLAAPGAPGDPILPRPIRILVLSDALPAIEIVYPGRDTLLGSDGTLPLVVDVRDDIGIATVELLSWRATPAGGSTPTTARRLGDGTTGQRRIVLRTVLDPAEDLVPGDTIYYVVRAYDRNATRGPAVSDTFRTWVPSLNDRREQIARRSDRLASESGELAEVAAELERLAREAERRSATEEGAGPDRARSGDSNRHLGFESTEEARDVKRRAEGLQARVEDLQDRVDALARDLAASPLSDPDLRRQLEELAESFRRLTASGLDGKIAELEEALRTLDPEAIRQALDRLGEDAARLREQIERSAALMERAALEQFLESSRNRAEELAAAQEAAAEAVEATPSWANEEERLADWAEELARALERLETRLAEADAGAVADSAGRAAESASDAAAGMREAAGDARAGQESSDPTIAEGNARTAASQAASEMGEAAATLGAAEEELAGEWQREALSAVQQARQEALELALEESRLADRLHGAEALEGPAWQSRQTAVRQGLDKLGRRLAEAGRKTALLDPGASTAVEETAGRLDEILERMAESGGRRRPSREETESVAHTLNDLALRLLTAERAIQSSRSGTGVDEALERMAALAQQQQALTQQTSTLLMPGLQGRAREERARSVAEEQARIGEELQKLDEDRERMLGRPEELAREAEEIARRLAETGDADAQTIERQRRLFRRMLDAGRSLEQEDLDPTRRESRTADQAPHEIPEIDLRLLDGPRFPHPSEALLRRLPAYYRPLIFDYFDRLNARRPPRGSDGSR